MTGLLMIAVWVLAALGVWFAWELANAPTVDEARCPYGAIECGGPCRAVPPCQPLEGE